MSASNDEELVFELVNDFLLRLKSRAQLASDERRKHVFCCAMMGYKFRQCWCSIRRDYRASQEFATTQCVGVFHFLKKNDCLIFLSTAEK